MPRSVAIRARRVAPVGVVWTHDEVELRHAPQQRSALLRRHAPRHYQLQAAHVLALALGLRSRGASSQGRRSLCLLTKKIGLPKHSDIQSSKPALVCVNKVKGEAAKQHLTAWT